MNGKSLRLKSLGESFSEFNKCSQEDIIELPTEARVIVNAGPGTGKTYTLIKKIIFMLNEEEIDPEQILVLCFSRAAVSVIKERLELAETEDLIGMEWRRIDIRTFDSFCTYMISLVTADNPNLLPGYHLEEENYEERIHTGISILNKVDDLLDYSHVIIDEVQDLVGIRAELVLTVLNNIPDYCGFTVLGDYCQALYDYLAEKGDNDYTSEDFYRMLFHIFDNAKKYEFSENHRQIQALNRYACKYRESILTGNENDRKGNLKRYLIGLEKSKINIKRDVEKLNVLPKNETIGILTRNNGQALKISTILHNKNIKHLLLHPSTNEGLAEWIGKVFIPYSNAAINESIFEEIFADVYPDLNAQAYWYALTETQKDSTKAWYEISDLLKGLITNAKNPLLFNTASYLESHITVSNIHRSKGREYDTVILGESILADAIKQNDIQEHRVCYVGVTRPRKRILLDNSSKDWFSYSGDVYNRCFISEKDFRMGRSRLNEIEFGYPDDISDESFAYNMQRQKLISNLKPGTQLFLIKNDNESDFYEIPYFICLDSQGNNIIGAASRRFRESLELVLQTIWDSMRCSIDYKYFPRKLDQIYVNGITTCVGVYSKKISGAKQFSGEAVWKGISVIGMARKMTR